MLPCGVNSLNVSEVMNQLVTEVFPVPTSSSGFPVGSRTSARNAAPAVGDCTRLNFARTDTSPSPVWLARPLAVSTSCGSVAVPPQ